MKKISFLLIIGGLIALAGSALQVRAQAGSIGVRIQPIMFEPTVNPGDTFSGVFHATNNEVGEKTYYFAVRNILRLTESGQPVFAQEPEESTPYEISAWVKLASESVVIGAGKTVDIPFTVAVPADASPGGHYGGIFLVSRPVRPSETGAGIGYEVGTILNFRIAGEVVEEADIREFRTDKTVYGNATVPFIARVENIGNVIVRPRGFIEITNMLGKTVAQMRVNNSAAAAFPKSVRTYAETWQGSWWTFGRHQAILSLIYGQDEKKTMTATVSFWILPLNIIVPVLGGILVFVAVLWVLVRIYIKRKLKQLGAVAGGGDRAEPMLSQRTQPVNRLVAFAITLMIVGALLLAVLFILLA